MRLNPAPSQPDYGLPKQAAGGRLLPKAFYTNFRT